ncbi:MAG: hypothetical protein KatS3mg114_0238 [Planctomycetaceae bacterium]|nr:MAG: hypothetical protein KatS3mg114_0238 [Planctomycetaceae bacterium]
MMVCGGVILVLEVAESFSCSAGTKSVGELDLIRLSTSVGEHPKLEVHRLPTPCSGREQV